MSTRYEYYTTGCTAAIPTESDNWKGHSFTPSEFYYNIRIIKLKVYRVGSPGTVTVELYACDASHFPTGSLLASGTFNGNSVTTNTDGEEVSITLDSSVYLSLSTEYVKVIKAPSGNASNYINMKRNPAGTYTGGIEINTWNGGGTWNADSGADMWFETWGDTDWVAGTEYPTGGKITPVTGITYTAITGGAAGTSEPSWKLGRITDNEVTWGSNVGMGITTEDTISLNSLKYTVLERVSGSITDPFATQINIGEQSYSSRKDLSVLDVSGLSGIGAEEWRAASPDSCYWSNLIHEYPGHMLPPRLATAIALPSQYTASDWNYGDRTEDPDSDWTDDDNILAAAGYAVPAAGVGLSQYIYVYFHAISCSSIRFNWDESTSNVCTGWVVDYYNLDTSAWVNLDTQTGQNPSPGTETLPIGSTKTISAVRIKLESQDAGEDIYLYYIQCYAESAYVAGTFKMFANFNGEKYLAWANTLMKLDSGRATYSVIDDASFLENITFIISTINSILAIYLGDTENYWSMSTAEAFTETNVADAYWAFQYDNKLFKCNTSGTVTYSTNPESATPTWSAAGTITDIADQIQGFEIGRDANGDPAAYCITKTKIKILDLTVPDWYDTELILSDHPNGGKGHTYINGKLYISEGLSILEYDPSTGAYPNVGLDSKDGLPIEFNGEITKLYGAANLRSVFIAVDGSQVSSGNGQSGLYVLDNGIPRCWWAPVGELFTNDAGGGILYGATWGAQTFTPATSHSLPSITLKIYKSGSPGTVTVSIRATDVDGKPTGADLASGTINGDGFQTSEHWETIMFSSAVSLTAATKYAIVVRATGGDASNYVMWTSNVASGTYAGGNICSSSDSGSTWTSTGGDYCFSEYPIAGVMNDIIVSSAESGYAVYWDCGGLIYYIDIPRGVQNPDRISQNYAVTGSYFSSWFDANDGAALKLAKYLDDYLAGVSTTEIIKLYYRINHATTALDIIHSSSSWTLLETYNAAGHNGINSESFASGAGVAIYAIQFRVDVVTPGSTAKPDIKSLKFRYAIRTGSIKKKLWTVRVICDGKHQNAGAKAQVTNLISCIESDTDVPFSYRPNSASDEEFYVNVSCPGRIESTGTDYKNSEFTLRIEER